MESHPARAPLWFLHPHTSYTHTPGQVQLCFGGSPHPGRCWCCAVRRSGSTQRLRHRFFNCRVIWTYHCLKEF